MFWWRVLSVVVLLPLGPPHCLLWELALPVPHIRCRPTDAG